MGGSAAVEFRPENGTDFIGADRGGHEGFGELFCEIRDSLGLLLNHDGRAALRMVSICRPQMAGPPCLNWPGGFRCVTLCGGLLRWASKQRATGSLEWGTRWQTALQRWVGGLGWACV